MRVLLFFVLFLLTIHAVVSQGGNGAVSNSVESPEITDAPDLADSTDDGIFFQLKKNRN